MPRKSFSGPMKALPEIPAKGDISVPLGVGRLGETQLTGRYPAPAGRASSQGLWLSQLHKRLKAYFRRGGSTVADAEDLASDVVVRLVSPDRPETQQNDAYAFTVARNLQRDSGRRAEVRQRHAGSADCDIRPLLHGGSDAPDVERVLISKEELAIVLAGLEELSERTRSMFLLCRLENRPQREIAEQFGVSVSAVEKNVAKAMLHLMQKVDWQR